MVRKKKLEDMSIEELHKEVSKLHKQTQFRPRKLEVTEEGTILLDSNNKQDQEWYNNDKDYDVL